MKAGFFHDAPLIEWKDGKVYSVGFGYEIWERYLKSFESVIVCTRKSYSEIKDINNYKVSSGINVEFKLNKEYKSISQLITSYDNINKTISEVVQAVDVCIIRLPSVIGILAIKECINQKKPWIVEVVGCCWDSLWNHGNIKGKIFAPIMYSINKYYIKKSNYAIYVSKTFLQKRYPCNGISESISDVKIDEIDEDILDKRIKKIEQLDGKSIVLGIVGSLDVEYKGHRTAIKAISELKKNGYNVHLKCLGGGDSTKWRLLAESLDICDRIEFCGTLPAGRPVLQWIDDIDMLTMPSLTEGLPRSLVEAMSRGCNILGSNVGGIPELIDIDFLFKAKDHNEMSEKIINLINNKDLMIKQSKSNFEKSKQYIDDELDKRRLNFYKLFKSNIYEN